MQGLIVITSPNNKINTHIKIYKNPKNKIKKLMENHAESLYIVSY